MYDRTSVFRVRQKKQNNKKQKTKNKKQTQTQTQTQAQTQTQTQTNKTKTKCPCHPKSWGTLVYIGILFGLRFFVNMHSIFEIGAFDIRNLFNWLYTVKPVRAEGQSQMS